MGRVSVNSQGIAEASKEQIYLRPILDNYELNLNFTIQGPPQIEDNEIWATINTARIYIKVANGNEHYIGLAQLERPVFLKTHKKHTINEQITFLLFLTNRQLSKMEEIRDGQDLTFIIKTKGEGSSKGYTNAVRDEWKVEIPKSKWIDSLKNAKYMDILILEVPMLPKNLSEEWIDIRHDLEEAQRLFMNREYAACVSKCRGVIQETGHKRFGKQNWHNPMLNLIGKNSRSVKEDKNRDNMDKDEREMALWAALKHYTHLAHHSKGEGGERLYTRSEARLALTLTATFVSI